MATQSPISTISYNSEAFLLEKLNAWLKAHIIQAYQYICHKGEDGDKDHIHLRIEPNKRLDPMDLQDELKEYVISSNKPLGCRPFRPSKEEDWILYVVHDAAYLKLKYGGGEKGEKIPYNWQDIKVPENYDMEVAFIRAKSHLEHSSVNLASRIREGQNPLNLILEGENPYLVNSLMHAISKTDYERVVNELALVNERLLKLVDAIHNTGYEVCVDDTGNFQLVPFGPGSSGSGSAN